MSATSIVGRREAARFARALIDVVVRESADGEAIGRELREFGRLMASHATLGGVLSNPAVPVPRKHALVGALLERLPGTTSITRTTLLLLAERDRLGLLPALEEAYQERLMEHLKVVRAEVATAVPLSADRTRALEESLARTTGRRVSLAARVDPSIIGGVVTQIGSVVYDGSVVRQLSRLKEKIVEGA